MFGQPASSHTVWSSCSCTRRFSRRYSVPRSARTFIHSGRRPGPTPGPGRSRSVATSARSTTSAPRARAHGAHDRVAHGAGVRRGTEDGGHRRDTGVGDPARHDVVEHREIGIDVEREPVHGAIACDADADRGDLVAAHPDPAPAIDPLARDPELTERVDERGLDAAHVRDHVAPARRRRRQLADRVAHELARTVERDVAAPVGRHERGPDGRRIHQHVRRVGPLAQRVRRRMLEEQQVVGVAPTVDRALQRQRLVVGRRARATARAASSRGPSRPEAERSGAEPRRSEPPSNSRTEHERRRRRGGHASSASQSWVSMMPATACRNDAA